ncbi:MAG TPA: hypothetical protein VIV11_02860 [Kofleriaceae bacterium]
MSLITVIGMSACAAEDPAPVDHTVMWTLENVNAEACTSLELYIHGPDIRQSLPCTTTTTTFQWMTDDVPVSVELNAMYWAIPFGCESMSCWQQRSMAGADAEFDETSESTQLQLEKIMQSPF